ncbi:hypothetical protein [Rhodanobacter denitrificans]|uniref:hypothetical protein n=1 Tax=Rhodanobacter denitrificans TaxID=666685 RepID=UPI001F2CF7FC|nr:hypothetical protein [Rhodanobacter denitrificans]UJJ60634.1 hypothetical protein LRK55_19560 [Rhodanobacter denitrificans]
MPAAFARTLGLIAAAMLVLSLYAPTAAYGELAIWIALAALGVLVATYPAVETSAAFADSRVSSTQTAAALPHDVRGVRARAAILLHLEERPSLGLPLVAAFMRKDLPGASELTREAAPALLAQRVRELTDRRAIELAALLGLDIDPAAP